MLYRGAHVIIYFLHLSCYSIAAFLWLKVILDMHVQKDHSAMHCSHECLGLDCKPCMQVCKHFFVGFPHWWQSCNLRYPKRTNSDTGCQPSSNTSKHPDGLKSSSRNESVFRKSSHLSNGTPRFEEHTCDGDIATNENAAASSEAGKGKFRGDYLEPSIFFSPRNISFQ